MKNLVLMTVAALCVVVAGCNGCIGEGEAENKKPEPPIYVLKIANDGTPILVDSESGEPVELKEVKEPKQVEKTDKPQEPVSSQVVTDIREQEVKELEAKIEQLNAVIESNNETLQAWNKWAEELRKFCAKRGVRIPYSATEQEAAKAAGKELPAIQIQQPLQTWNDNGTIWYRSNKRFQGRWFRS